MTLTVDLSSLQIMAVLDTRAEWGDYIELKRAGSGSAAVFVSLQFHSLLIFRKIILPALEGSISCNYEGGSRIQCGDRAGF